MRVGIDGRIFLKHQSGIVRYATELAKALFETRPKNQYIVYIPGADSEETKKRIATVHSLLGAEDGKYKIRVVNLMPILWRTMLFTGILDKEVDVFHGMAYILPYVPKFMRKVKVVASFHGLQPVIVAGLPLKEKLYWGPNFRLSAMFADRIISVSKNLKQEINKRYGYRLDRIDVTYAGISKAFYIGRSEKGSAKVLERYGLGDFYIFYSGAGDLPQKNVRTILKAAQIMADKYIFTPPIIISRTDLSKYDGEKYPSTVKGVEWIDERDLPHLYANAAISIYASYCEGFGSPIIEARAAKSPVIASGVSAMTEAAQGKAVLVEDPFSADEWAEKIYGLYSDEKLREKLSANDRKGLEDFSWKNVAKKTLETYARLYKQ